MIKNKGSAYRISIFMRKNHPVEGKNLIYQSCPRHIIIKPINSYKFKISKHGMEWNGMEYKVHFSRKWPSWPTVRHYWNLISLTYHPSSRYTMIDYVQYHKAQYYKECKGANVPYDNERPKIALSRISPKNLIRPLFTTILP